MAQDFGATEVHSQPGTGATTPVPAGDTAERSVPALRIKNLSKSFNGITVLHPFELEIGRGEVHMLLGQNGSGKSTLIKILSGYHLPDDQHVEASVAGQRLEFGSPASAGQLGLRFVHQDLGLVDSESVADNLLLGQKYPTRFATIRGRALRRASVAALARAGLDVDPSAKVSTLSPAQRTGVAIARALWGWEQSCAVLVLDEPTATLPTQEVEHLHKILRSVTATGVGALYVTHNLEEVAAVGDRVSILRDGHLVASSAVAEIDHATMVHRLVGREVEQVQRAAPAEAAGEGAQPALSVRALTTGVLQGVDFHVQAGEIVGIYGLTGSGRESILGALFGSIKRESGVVRVNGRRVEPFSPVDAVAAGLAYVPPNRKTQGGFMLLSATDNLSITDLKAISRAAGMISVKRERSQVVKWFDELDVRPSKAYSEPLSTFSGGNQQKIIMAKWLRRQPDVLLLDEPTQGVDVGAKAQLHQKILDVARAKTAVAVSSTDTQELSTLCTRVLILRQGRIVEMLCGSDVTEDQINRAVHTQVRR